MTVQDHTDAAPAVHPDGDAAAGPAPRRRPRRLRTALAVLAAVAVAGAAGAAATGALGGGGDDRPSAAPSGPSKTAEVERTTLTRTETVDGSLGYGTATAVQAPGAASSPSAGDTRDGTSSKSGEGSGAGILTALPGEGDTIRRGEAVYRVDDRKVPLLYGSTPLYRTLDVGSEGKDVAMLEKNLAKLGYTGFTVDDAYTEGTAEAVRAWQDDLGRERTGTVSPGDAVLAPGARRVAEVKAAIGTVPTGEILSWTGTERTVGVDLDVRYEDLVDDGTKATVRLPDGTSVEATVTDVGTAATAAPSQGGAASGSGGSGSAQDATLPVQLSVEDQRKLGRYQAAPVDVILRAETRRNVLAVPVEALTARREGGYAVQAVRGGRVEYLPVKPGMFADGMVEISGTGVTEGLVVGVAR
ncbi:peptidoglycan-binding domain-containing protein [Streptomyces sp. NPDC006393]|uniref:peptidoglycan-binding domain-containing protein n=1 Tax=Streptomyces sp. NPDC006393 TaxID=3156763 RepID=UPI0033E29530